MHRSDVTKYRLDYGPRRFHGILTDEEHGLTVHGVREQSLIGLQLAGSSLIHGGEFHGHRVQSWTRTLDSSAKTQRKIRTQPEAKIVTSRTHLAHRRPSELDENLTRRHRQTLANPNQEWHAGPAPRIHFNADSGEGLNLRVGSDSGLIAVSPELPAHQVRRIERGNHAKHLDLLVVQRLEIHIRWRLHRQQSHYLKHVILKDIANRPDLIIKSAPSIDSKIFCQGNLHAVDVVPVPYRLQEGVGKAEAKQVLHRFLTEVMVNAKDGWLRENRVQYAVQFLRRCQVSTKGLLDDDSSPLGTTRSPQRFHDCAKEVRRNGKVVLGRGSACERFVQLFKGFGI